MKTSMYGDVGRRWGRLTAVTLLALAATSAARAQVTDTKVPLNYNFHGYAHTTEAVANATSGNADIILYRSIADRGPYWDPADTHAFGTNPIIGTTGITYSLFDALGWGASTAPNASGNALDCVHLGSRVFNRGMETTANSSTQSGVSTAWAPLFNVVSLSSNGVFITGSTDVAHGLSVGQRINIAGASPVGFTGAFTVTGLPDSQTFTCSPISPFTVAAAGSATGSIFCNSTSTPLITALSASGATVTATTNWAHGFTATTNSVNITGSSIPEYNGLFAIATVNTPNTQTFTYTNLNGPAGTPTGTQILLGTCDHTGDQVTTLAAPIALDANTEIGVLYSISDSGGQFDCVLGFTDSTTQTVRLASQDWVGTVNPPIVSNKVSATGLIKHTVGGTTSSNFRAMNNNDTANLLAFGTSSMQVAESVISVPKFTAAGINLVGKQLSSITLRNAFFNPTQITALSVSGGVATATVGSNAGFIPGMPIRISGVLSNGVSPREYDGDYQIDSLVGTNQFRFQTAATGTASAKMFATGPSGSVQINSIATTGTLPTATATVTTAAAHNFTTGDSVTIEGASVGQENGTFSVTVTGGSTFTYVPQATGTPSAQMQVTRSGVGRGYMVHAVSVRKGTATNASCATAVSIPTTNAIGTTVNGSSSHAVNPGTDPATSSCGTADTAAVYYTYMASGNNLVSISTCAPFASTVSVYTGACGSLSSVACNASNTANCGGASGNTSSSTTFTAAVGTLYYIRVAGQNGGMGNFALTVQEFGYVNCAGAVAVGTGDTFGTTLATPSGGTTPCGGNDVNAVWFQYTATGTGVHDVEARTCWDGQNATLTPAPLVSGVTGVRPTSCSSSTLIYPLDTTLAVYALGQCGQSSPTPIACNDNGCSVSSRLTWSATPGATYLIRVASKSSGFPTGGSPAAGPTGPFVLHIDDPVHTDLAVPLAFNWNGICHGTRTVNDANFFSEQNVTTPAVHENRTDLNGYRAISDRGLLFDPNNNTPNAFNYGGTIGYQGMRYQVYGTALQKDLVHLAQAANPYRGGGLNGNFKPNTQTWASPTTTDPWEGYLPVWLAGDPATGVSTYDHYSNVLSNVSAMNAVFGDDTKLGLIYHMTNLSSLSGSFRVTLTFNDGFQALVTCNGTDWYGGSGDATPCGGTLPAAFPAGVERHRVLGVYNAVQNTDRALAAPSGQLKVVESVISTASLTTAGFDPRGHGILTSIKFDNVVSTQTATNVSIFAACLRDPLSYNFTNGPSAIGTVSPNQLNAGGTGTMAVTAILGSAPQNTITSVVVNATAIGLSSSFALNVVPGSNTTQWTRLVSFPVNTSPNTFTLPFVATDAQGRQATGDIIFSVVSPTGAITPNPVAVGNTVKATFVFGTAGGISSISVDASQLGVGTLVALHDNGTGGDLTANDGTWAADFQVPPTTVPGDYNLPFTLTDTASNVASGTLPLTVTPPSGACCTNATGACVFGLSTACTATTVTYNGDNSTCQTGTPSPSCPITGICCTNTTGACGLLYGGSCPTSAVLGAGTTCSAGTPSSSCPVSQSCCNGTTGACTFIYGASCPSGATASGGVTCDANTCPASGTCCNDSTGACTLVYGGNACGTGTSPSTGTVCGAGTCPVVAVCCDISGVCIAIYGGLCPANSTLASGTTCDGNVTCPATGSCCNGATGACTLNYTGSCNSPLTFNASTSCSPSPCTSEPHTCENMDGSGSLPVGWLASSTGAGAPWAVVSDQSHSSSNAVFTNDVLSASSQILELPAVTATGTITLDFWSYYSVENNWDGWVVEYSTDGGANWVDVGQAGWAINGYTHAALNANSANPLTGRAAFSGASLNWVERIASIPASAGQMVSIRFVMGSDGSIAGTGVWLDDICLAGIQIGSPGVCCRGSTCTTAYTSAVDCGAHTTTSSTSGPGWAFVATASPCNAGVNPDGTYSGGLTSTQTPCCFANYNHNATLEVQDIFDFLNDWFAGRPIAIPGGDGTSNNGIAVQNIFNFLNAWFGGGCL